MRYLSAEDVLVLHALIIDGTSGSHGLRDLGLLQSAVHKPQSRFGEKDLYPGAYLKAAVLLEAIANYHVFIDGNKRTAFATAIRFLHLNGYSFTANNKEIEACILKVAQKELEVPELALWLKRHSHKKV